MYLHPQKMDKKHPGVSGQPTLTPLGSKDLLRPFFAHTSCSSPHRALNHRQRQMSENGVPGCPQQHKAKCQPPPPPGHTGPASDLERLPEISTGYSISPACPSHPVLSNMALALPNVTTENFKCAKLKLRCSVKGKMRTTC